MLRRWGLLCVIVAWLLPRFETFAAAETQLPNVLWIVAEDINPHLGCYGDNYARTPNLDRFASSGIRYRNCWSTAPVCAPARTALITGCYPSSLGAEHMRSEVPLPSPMQFYPQLLRGRGYYCSNNSKEDYNLIKRGRIWDDSSKKAHWRNRRPGQPFFAVFNIEVTHESQIRTRPHRLNHDPNQVRLPSYHPDTPEVRHDWAQYYDNITELDALFERRLEELRQDGLMEDTIVFFYGDNGSGMPRSKRWPYNSGLNVPLIVSIPPKFRHLAPKEYQPGHASSRLVGFVDFAPTLLSLAGIPAPTWMQGQAFMGKYEAPPASYLFGLRGRMDERYDLVRSVRNERFIYIRNYMPHLIYGQYLDYMFQTPTTRVWKQLYDQGKLTPPRTFFWNPKPAEELYDLQNDRDEVQNLVSSTDHQTVLRELREALRNHILQTRDTGFLPETEQHSRATPGLSIYEAARVPSRYPLERILSMADLASSSANPDRNLLSKGLDDSDSAVRYWAVLGFYIRGSNAVWAVQGELSRRLEDPSPAVRVAAAGALAKFGSTASQENSFRVLRQLAPADRNGVYVSLLALNAIASIDQKPSWLVETVRTMSGTDPAAPGRANGYVQRLQELLTSNGMSRSSIAIPSRPNNSLK